MKFEVTHTFPLSPETCWKELFSPEYEAANDAEIGLVKEIQSDQMENGVRVRRLVVQSGKELPRAVAAVLGSAHLVYESVETYTPDDLSLHWTVEPRGVGRKVQANGTYEIRATEAGCERLVKGEIRVAIPIVGGKIEKAVAEELRSSYGCGATFAMRWLENKNLI